jgi:protein phosphatase 1A
MFRMNLAGTWLSVTPDVKQVELDEDVEFIIIASDGLWDSFKRCISTNILGVLI